MGEMIRGRGNIWEDPHDKFKRAERLLLGLGVIGKGKNGTKLGGGLFVHGKEFRLSFRGY